MDRTQSGATTRAQSELGSNENEEVLYILKSSRTGASPSDCLVSYLGHSLEESYPSAVGNHPNDTSYPKSFVGLLQAPLDYYIEHSVHIIMRDTV